MTVCDCGMEALGNACYSHCATEQTGERVPDTENTLTEARIAEYERLLPIAEKFAPEVVWLALTEACQDLRAALASVRAVPDTTTREALETLNLICLDSLEATLANVREHSGGSTGDLFVKLAEQIEALAAVPDTTRHTELLDRVIDAGVDAWHNAASDSKPIHEWLGLTAAEYAAWVEGSAPKLLAVLVSGEGTPHE